MTDIRYLLNIGRDHACTYGELAELLNVPRRTLEEDVQQARLDGVPIVSGSDGLWIAQDARDALSMGERLRGRALHQLLTARAMRATGRRMQRAQQTALFWEWVDRESVA